MSLDGDLTISFSIWNIGEVLGVSSMYRRGKWLSDDDYNMAREGFIMETIRLVKLGLVRLIPVRVRLVTQAWSLIEKHRIYEADAIQIASADYVDASKIYSGDKRLVEICGEEGLEGVYLG